MSKYYLISIRYEDELIEEKGFKICQHDFIFTSEHDAQVMANRRAADITRRGFGRFIPLRRVVHIPPHRIVSISVRKATDMEVAKFPAGCPTY